MNNTEVLKFIKSVLKSMPLDWIKLTTHRLDVYNENLAKVEFLEQFEKLAIASKSLPTEELSGAFKFFV